MEFKKDKSFADRLDREDSLAGFRERFCIPKHKDGADVTYFCGNSLGLQPRSVVESVEQELKDWASLGVDGHFHAKNPWMPYHEFLTDSTARLVGAEPAEVVVMNSLTVNLHLMMVSFYRPDTSRFKVLIEGGAFPSDQYAVQSQIRFHGYDPDEALIELQPRPGEHSLRPDDVAKIIEAEGEQIALILLGGVNYYTGQCYDMAGITALGHDRGCTVGFDLAHAAGNVVLSLHDWNVDFAAWCSYKYLNAGPGSTAGCFVHERHASNESLPRFAGWWGHDKKTRFLMGPKFRPIRGAEGWQLSNPPILPLAALRASMAIFDEAGMQRLRDKSERLTGYLEYVINALENKRLSIITPHNPAERGCQLSIRIGETGRQVYQALTDRGLVCDWREPDVIRVAPVPLYNSFADVFRFGEILKEVS